MAGFKPDFNWNLNLTHKEARLVLMGLAGMLTGREAEEAKELNTRLRKQRVHQVTEYLQSISINDSEEGEDK